MPKLPVEELKDYLAQLELAPIDNPLPTHMEPVQAPGQDYINFARQVPGMLIGNWKGKSGKEYNDRTQLWPEKMATSAATLPHDVMTGEEPIIPFVSGTDDWVSTPKNQTGLGKLLNAYPVAPTRQDAMIERVQDMASVAGGGTLGVKPEAASLGSGMVRAYHGTSKPGFTRFNKPNSEEFMIDRALGTHVSKDPEIANTFATDRPGQRVDEGAVYPVDIPDESKFLEVHQPLLPYIEDKNTVKTARNVYFDQNQIERLVMKTAFEKDPELLARYLVQARGVKSIDEALPLAKQMAQGEKVELPIDGKGFDLDKFVRDVGGKPYNKEDRVKAVEIFKKDMQDKGYVGLKYINTSPMETVNAKDPTSYIIFEPHKHIRNALTGTLMSDTSETAALNAAAKTVPTFYSAVENAVKNAKQNVATPEQWLGYLKNQPGVKQEELDWVLGDLPKQKSGANAPLMLTKKELEDYVAAHKIELKEVNKGELKFNKDSKYALPEVVKVVKESGERPGELELTLANDGDAYRALTKKFPELSKNEDWANVVAKDVFGGDTMPTGTSKFSQWQLPGGSNYREMLLSLPNRKRESAEVFAKDFYNNTKGEGGRDWDKLSPYERQDWINAASEQQQMGKGREDFTSSHWDEPNVLAHVRMNDRDIPTSGYTIQNSKSGFKGKFYQTEEQAKADIANYPDSIRNDLKVVAANKPIKSLHVEEIQSDWHQKGRIEGYQGEKEALQPKFDAIEKKIQDSGDEAVMGQPELKDALKLAVDKKIINKNEADIYQRYVKIENTTSPVPDAPFKSNWSDLALKRIIRHAADGYDAVSWTPGEAQAARYDLSKHIDSIAYNPNTGYFKALDKSGKDISNGPVPKEKLADTIGKEAAEKLLNTKPNNLGIHSLQNADLKIGGEGMKAFYDKMLVDKVNALAKKYGGKVEKVEIHKDAIKAYDEYVNNLKERFRKNLYDGAIEQGFSLEKARNFADKHTDNKDIRTLAIGMNEISKLDKFTRAKQNYEKSSKDVLLLRLPQGLKDVALQKGFSLFADSSVAAGLNANNQVMLQPVEHDPFRVDKRGTKKVILKPVSHNPFEEK